MSTVTPSDRRASNGSTSSPTQPAPPALAALLPMLRDEPAMLGVLGRLRAALSVPEAARSFVVAGIAELSHRRPLIVATATAAEAHQLVADLGTFLGAERVELFPAWETLPFERVSPSVETMGRRLRVVWRLADPERWPDVVVAPGRALVQRLGPHVDEAAPVVITAGDTIERDGLMARLVGGGYRREYQVEHRGEFAVRGSIIDVFPSTADAPVRMDLWGDEVDRLVEFSVADQRAVADLESVEIFAARELIPTPDVAARAERLIATEPWGREQWERLASGETFDGMESWLAWLTPDDRVLFDLVGADAQVLLIEPRRMRDRAAEIIAEEVDLAKSLAGTWGAGGATFPRLHLDFDRLLTGTDAAVWTMTTVAPSPEVASVAASAWQDAGADGDRLAGRLADLAATGHRVVVAAESAASAERIDRLLRSFGVTYDIVGGDEGLDLDRMAGQIVVAPLERGAVLSGVKLALLAEADLTGRRRAHRPQRPRKRQSQAFFDDLEVGSYVVHHHHGVARFAGMVRRDLDGVERDYLLLEYRGDDRLYVPSDQIDVIRHYTGGDRPALSRMGGADFARTKAKVRAEVVEVAQELVVLYQKRLHTAGHRFGPDTPWQHELEQAFPFQETPDQLTAIADVKADMEADVPMDRLICGDVGFGKTEVAIRAAFKAAQEGFQVAVLVPTTLLAQQHLATFSERLAGFGLRVEVLSRFLTTAQARSVVSALATGEVDVVIGTHRLLSDDVAFKRLGLLVIDEEQRFGVSHKEAIKQLSTDVDVLTLTATPIPRTMEMSLTGIRDISLLTTPPAERQPILTYVGGYDERAAAEAIRRELLREGQVFFVHNRIADIDQIAEGIRDLVPEARVAVAHGQMDEGSLEQIVLDFWEGRFDVLVCTTIIESGIDMPTVNTLVVDRADLLGLGQLHQLRGRVGRAGQRAYAYLFFPPERELSEEAYERLKTIGENTELGSGYRIAMRDLEIRGAGNLLGTGQSGHIAAVGYDLYCQMVNEALAELNGVESVEQASVHIELAVAAHLPDDYVVRDDLRLDAYRRLAEVRTSEDVADIEAEWQDRYGPVPPPAEALLGVARLRAECVRCAVADVTVTIGTGLDRRRPTARLSPLKLATSKQMRLERLYRGSLYKPDTAEVIVALQKGADVAVELVALLQALVPADDSTDGPVAGGGDKA